MNSMYIGINGLMMHLLLLIQYVSAEFSISEAEIQELSPELLWAVQDNNPMSVAKSGNQIVFDFEWLGSLWIDDIGLSFSVCDKMHQDDTYKCSSPEIDPYRVSLTYNKVPRLSIDVVIIGLDIFDEPIVSTGVHRFHYNDHTVRYPRYVEIVDDAPSEEQIQFLIVNAVLLIVMLCCFWLLMFLCCIRSATSVCKYPGYKVVKTNEKIKEAETIKTTITAEGEETIPENGIFVEPV
eukprot:312667_1